MVQHQLDLSALEKALQQLADAINFYDSDQVQHDPRLLMHMRAATIQAFEFTYELCWKMVKRYLEMTEPSALDIEHMSFADLIRTACERGLLQSDLATWLTYRKERGTTSHTYDQDKANEVLMFMPDFLLDAQHLYVKLLEANAKT